MDCSAATSDEKAMLFGEAFRNIHVLSFWVRDGTQVMNIVLNGEVISLIGDPEAALTTLLGGQADQETPN